MGRKGTCFHITPSVRQGCPLAPFLFLLYVDVLDAGLQALAMQIHGLKILEHKSKLGYLPLQMILCCSSKAPMTTS